MQQAQFSPEERPILPGNIVPPRPSRSGPPVPVTGFSVFSVPKMRLNYLPGTGSC